MISTQRLIMLVIGLNLLIGLSLTIYENPATYNPDELNEDKSYYQQFGINYDDEIGADVSQKANYDQEISFGSMFTWSKLLVDVVWNGVNFASVNSSDVTTDLEKIVVNMLIFFRAFMAILIVVELLMFIKNKKQS